MPNNYTYRFNHDNRPRYEREKEARENRHREEDREFPNQEYHHDPVHDRPRNNRQGIPWWWFLPFIGRRHRNRW